jgi:hypothetical protein
MSRSAKGSKGPGFEYWGKRPGNGLSPGKATKKITHRLERLKAKEALKKTGDDPHPKKRYP